MSVTVITQSAKLPGVRAPPAPLSSRVRVMLVDGAESESAVALSMVHPLYDRALPDPVESVYETTTSGVVSVV